MCFCIFFSQHSILYSLRVCTVMSVFFLNCTLKVLCTISLQKFLVLVLSAEVCIMGDYLQRQINQQGSLEVESAEIQKQIKDGKRTTEGSPDKSRTEDWYVLGFHC